MPAKKILEQHIAVFGESGSGKTVLLSSFYGPTQEKGFSDRSRFKVVAGADQSKRLYQNWVGMRDDRELPDATEFRSIAYTFTLKMAAPAGHPPAATASHNSLRVVWHDYPGEWFEKEVAGEEAERRVEGFRSLLGSDVALLLVDAQRLIDNKGQEHAYLKSLFYNYREGFDALRDDILPQGKPLVRFPRIWIVALSKADLLPDMDVHAFRDLVIGKAGTDLMHLGETLASMVDSPEQLSVGDDFVLLSSAKFTPDQIVVSERIGIDLILPIASVLPFEKHMQWVGAEKVPAQIGRELLKNVDAMAGVLGGVVAMLAQKGPAPVRAVAGLLASLVSEQTIKRFAQMGQEKLQQLERIAIEKREYVAAVLARFRLDLMKGEEDEVLLRGDL